MLMSVVGGLGIFLLGMKYMSEGMQTVAGDRLRRMISAVTDNRLLAIGTGLGVTCMVQSSTVTTVLVVGLVNAGFMALHQAIGVIIGANIGTTITGWILVLKVGKYGLPILGVAAMVFIFSRRDRPRYIAMAVMGLGMAFFGLELMKDGFDPLRGQPWFTEAMTWFDASTYWGVLLCVLVGCLLTFIVQSSSATLAITIGLAATGAIPFPTAAALVMGENIGTTITAWLAAIGANTSAKRAAYGHVLFNVIGAIWLTTVFRWYLPLASAASSVIFDADPRTVTMDSPDFAAVMTAGIATVHSGFNIVNTLLFLPFVRKFARFLEWLVPEKGREVPHLRHLDARFVDTPALAIAQSQKEVVQMGTGVVKMLDWTGEIVFDGKLAQKAGNHEKLIKKVFHREQVLDTIEREIVVFLTEVLDGSVPYQVAEIARQQLRVTHEYESMSDAAASILKAYLKLREGKLDLPESLVTELKHVHELVNGYAKMVHEAHQHERPDVITRAISESTAITRHIKRLREDYLRKLSEQRVDPLLSITYTSLLSHYRRLKEHALNVAEALVGVTEE